MIFLDENSQEARKWICKYCNQVNFEARIPSERSTSDKKLCPLEWNSIVKMFDCVSCGQDCFYPINQLRELRNPIFSQESAATADHDAFYHDMTDRDIRKLTPFVNFKSLTLTERPFERALHNQSHTQLSQEAIPQSLPIDYGCNYLSTSTIFNTHDCPDSQIIGTESMELKNGIKRLDYMYQSYYTLLHRYVNRNCECE